MMDSQNVSHLSSLKGEFRPEDFIKPHYKEAYRLAIDQLLSGGRETYREFLKGERVASFLSEEEQLFITANAQRPPEVSQVEEPPRAPLPDSHSSSGTYWPMHSDVATPDLELGWPEEARERLQTSVDLLHHPPRQNSVPIKEVIRKHIQDARQVIAIVMDVFTDVDIFKETVDAAGRGVPVYVLLDDLNLKSFLAMAENQDVKIKQLRNMRVRTVRGHEYLSQSGAKFHGVMKQNFLLVDCKTAIYGSYSFMWSFEKIHLSMVQVITGHLVKSFDEEFRTLYARSTVPDELVPLPGMPKVVMNGRPVMTSYVPGSGNTFERKNHLRHTLDAAYLKSCERQVGMKLPEEKIYEEPPEHVLLNDYQVRGTFNHTPLQLHPPETTNNYLKRHSYAAGERQNGPHVPQNERRGASNWNLPGDACSPPPLPHDRGSYPAMDGYTPAPPMCRGRNVVERSHRSYNDHDQHLLSVQQYMPTLENTSKSFMRTWRIESYLKNPDASFEDTLDQYETPDTKPAGSLLPSRMRSSLVFNSPIPEHMENHCYGNNLSMNLSANPVHYSSMQWGITEMDDKRRNFEEFKMQSLQMLDTRDNVGYNAGRIPHNSLYASLGRSKGGKGMKSPDILTDDWNKRHSVADPRNNSELRSPYESPGHMYGGPFSGRYVERGPESVPAHYGHYGSNLNEDQRSVSHYDVKYMADIQKPPSWQEPPSRTVSAAALDGESKGSAFKPPENNPHQHFLKKSSRKIRSLLNIPEKREAFHPHSAEQDSLKSCNSTDTLTGEEDGRPSPILLGRDPRRSDAPAHPYRTPADHPAGRQDGRQDGRHPSGKASNPRFDIEEHRQTSPAASPPSGLRQQSAPGDARPRAASHGTGNSRADPFAERRPKSRFESYSAPERKPFSQAEPSGWAGTASSERGKSSVPKKGSTANEHHASRSSHGHHENKLGKFIQRMGHLINKK